MSKFAELPDGTKLEFPDDAEDSVIDSVVKKHLGVSVEEPTEPSQLATFGKNVVESIVPSATGLMTGVKGASMAAAVTPPVLPVVGPFAKPIAGIAGGLVGGVLGGMGGQYLQGQATKYVPDEVKTALGFDEATRKAEDKAHPLTAFAGKLAPNLAAFRPGALPNIVDDAGKVVLSSNAQRAGMAALGGGMEAGTEFVQEGKVDPAKVAMAAAFQGIAATPTKLGKKLIGESHAGMPKENIDPMANIPDAVRNSEDATNKAVFLDNSIERLHDTIAHHTAKIEDMVTVLEEISAKKNPSLAQTEAAVKLEAAIEARRKKIDEAYTTIDEHDAAINALTDFAGISRDELLPPREVPPSEGPRTNPLEVAATTDAVVPPVEDLVPPNPVERAIDSIKQAQSEGVVPAELPAPSVETVERATEIPPTAPNDTLQNARTFRTETGDIGFKAANDFLRSALNMPLAVAKRFLSPWSFKNIWGDNKIVTSIGDMALKNRNEAVQLINRLLYGDVSTEQFKADFGSNPLKLFKLNKAQNSNSLLKAIENVKYKEIGDMVDGFVAAFRDGVSPFEHASTYFPNATKEQLNLLRVVDHVVNTMHETTNKDLMARGLAPIPKLPGYFPTSNNGKFYVDHRANGQILERSWFYSEKEAKDYANRLMQKDSRTTATVEARQKDVDYAPIMEILDQIIASGRQSDYAEHVRTNIAQNASSVGKHKEHRSLIRGFSGERIGSAEERGKNFAQGLVDWVTEYANAARVRKLMYDSSTYFGSDATKLLTEQQPNAMAVAKHFLDNELNLYGTKEPTKQINQIGDWVNKQVNDVAYSINGKHLSGDVIESGFNTMKRLGYNMVLTSAPVTWISQALATIQSSRMFFKGGNANPVEALGAASKGIYKTIFKQYDEDAMRGLAHVSQNMDYLHKTIHADLGGLDAASINKSSLDKWYSRLVGEKLTEGADTFSRVVTYNMAYEMLKAQGMRGKALWEKAGQVSNENMIPMGRENLPSIYKELGFVGTAISPLKGFIHGSLSNLVTDVKDVAQAGGQLIKNRDAKSLNNATAQSLALTANMLSMMIMGGVIGLPFLADYEYIRQLLIKSGHVGYETLPSWNKLAEQAPPWTKRGMVSYLTNVDMSASTRYQSILKPYGDIVGAASFADTTLPISNATKLAGGVAGVLKDVYGSESDPMAQKNWDAVLPRGVARGVKDDIYDKTGMTQFGKRGDALVQRGTTERVAKYLGSSSVAEAEAREKNAELDMRSKSMTAQKQKIVDLFLSQSPEDKQAATKMLNAMVKQGDITPQEAATMIKNEAFKQHRPLLERMTTNNQGQLRTQTQARTMRELLEMGYKPNENR